MANKAKGFLTIHKENADFNQYWYSTQTISFLAEQAALSKRCCFLSTPSVFYTLFSPKEPSELFLFDVSLLLFSMTLSLRRIMLIFTNMTLIILKRSLKNLITTLILYSLIRLLLLRMFGRNMLLRLKR